MGKGDKAKRMTLEGAEAVQPFSKEKADSAILSAIQSGRRGSAISLLLIAATAILIYSNTFSSPFHFDDETSIIYNYKIRSLSHFWPPTGLRYTGYLSFAINFYFGGLNVFGYHLVNIVIHIINGILVWWLVILTFETPGMKRGGISRLKGFIALAAALVFVSHPIQTQAVTYIVQRFASLATLFYLLSLILFIKGRLSLITQNSKLKTILYISASLFSAILAMKTKEISFTLPFIILLYEFMFFRSFRIILLAPFLIPLLVIPLSIIGADKPLGDIIGDLNEFARETKDISRGTYLLTQFRVIITYIRLLFLPVEQNLDYDYPLSSSLFEPGVFFSFIFLLSIFCLAIYLYVRSRRGNNGYALLVSFGILWFFITLSVESSIIPIQDVIFEHRLYLPGAGAVIAFSAAILYLLDHARLKVSPITVTSVLLLVTAVPLGIAAYNRNLVWRDGVTLWKDVVKKSPAKARGHNNLGNAYRAKGLYDKGIEYFQIAIRLKPDYAKAHNNLGNSYYDKGWYDKAIEHYQIAIRLRPDYIEVYNNLGNSYYAKGLYDKAIEYYQAAIRLRPDYIEVYNNLGNAYRNKGSYDKAIEHYQIAIRLRPDYIEVYNNLGNAYRNKGSYDKAIEYFQIAIRLRPDYPEAYNNLGNAYRAKGMADKAIQHYQTAIRLRPDLAEAHNSLGNAYSAKGLADKAIQYYQTAIRLRPDLAEAYNNLGNAYRAKGMADKAMQHYQTAIRLRPDLAEAHNSLGNAYSAKGLTEEAMQHYQTAIRLRPDLAEAHNNLGTEYSAKGLTEEAMQHYQTAIRLKPDFAKAHFNLGLAYMAAGLTDKAREHLRIAVSLNPLLFKLK